MSEEDGGFEEIIRHLSDPLSQAKAQLCRTLANLLMLSWIVAVVPLGWMLWTAAF